MTVEYLNKSMNKDSKKLLKQFKQFNSEVDEINNTSFVKIFPELTEWYETI